MKSNSNQKLDIYIYDRINLYFKRSLKNNYHNYNIIYTNDIDLLNFCPNSRLLYKYPINFHITDFTKTDFISCLAISNLFNSNFENYKKLFSKYKKGYLIDFYKYDSNNETLGEIIISKKSEEMIYKKYRFNIIFNEDYLIGSNLLRTLLSKNIPIIFGKNIYHNIFNTNGWVFVNEIDSFDPSKYNKQYYQKYLDTIENNYNFVENMINKKSIEKIKLNLERKKITILLSYYNQEEALKKHIEEWLSYPDDVKDKFSFMIIDDCSKINCLNIIKNYNISTLNLQVLRSTEDLVCNIAGVRNLSAQKCDTPWMVILDMDTLIDSKMAGQMLELIQNNPEHIAFKFNRKVADKNHPKNNQMHPAVTLIRREDYWNVGGCEEDLVGSYGQTDPCFWYRARGKINIKECKDIFLNYLPYGESKINRDTRRNYKIFMERKNKNNWSEKYVRFKWTWLLNNQV